MRQVHEAHEVHEAYEAGLMARLGIGGGRGEGSGQTGIYGCAASVLYWPG